MLSLIQVKRNFLYFATGKIASGILGAVWLAALVRVFDQPSLGIYFALLSLFEISQLFSSFGLYSFTQRYLPQAYVSVGRSEFAKLVGAVVILRLLSLALVAAFLLVTWDQVTRWQEWPPTMVYLGVVIAFLMLEGLARFLDGIFESVIQQGYSQLVSVCRNIARIMWLASLGAMGNQITVMHVIQLEVALAGIFGLLGLVVLSRNIMQMPLHVAGGTQISVRRAVGYCWRSYLALAVGQFCGLDALRLLVGHFGGATAVATYGLAQAIADIVRRYMPMQLFMGLVRTVIIARHSITGDSTEVQRQASLIHKLNAFFLFAVAGWAAACGATALLVLSKKDGFGEAGPLLVGFLMLLGLQALRMVLAMLATVREDGRSILIATLVSGVGVAVAWFAIPAVGPWGGLIGAFLAELAYLLVLRIRLNLALGNFVGGLRPYLLMFINSSLAAAAVLMVPVGPPQLTVLALQSALFGLLFLLLMRVWRAFTSAERSTINQLLPYKAFIW